MRLCAELAVRQGISPDRARWAGLLHDCARDLPIGRLRRYALRSGRKPSSVIRSADTPGLLHGPVSRTIAQSEFRLTDRDVLQSIESHTVGRVPMSTLEKIVYVADYASSDRRFKASSSIRRLARRSFQEAFRRAVMGKIRHVVSRHRVPHPQSLRLLTALLNGFPV